MELLDPRVNAEAWCSNPKNGYPNGGKHIMQAFNNIWKVDSNDRVRALANFLLSVGSILPTYSSKMKAVDMLAS
jgi:hypothetical protein